MKRGEGRKKGSMLSSSLAKKGKAPEKKKKKERK